METNQGKIAVRKVALLYALRQAAFPLDEEALAELCASLHLMEYFDLKSNLHDLLQTQWVVPRQQRNGLFYALSPTGADALSLFEDNLLRSLRAAIDGYLSEHAQELRLRTCTHAESIRLSEHHYRVTLQIMEDDLAIFELTFFADSAQEADKYLVAWKTRALSVYASAFDALLSKKNPGI